MKSKQNKHRFIESEMQYHQLSSAHRMLLLLLVLDFFNFLIFLLENTYSTLIV